MTLKRQLARHHPGLDRIRDYQAGPFAVEAQGLNAVFLLSLVVGNRYRCRTRRGVTGAVFARDGDGVDPAVAGAAALRP
jgi:hypothetical protein